MRDGVLEEIHQPLGNISAVFRLPAGQFGLGLGGAHAPDEFWLIESSNPKVAGMDGAAASFVEFLYACR